MSQTYIAGYDGSSASRSAVAYAVRLADVQGDHVLAAHAYPHIAPTSPRGAVFDKELQDGLRDQARETLEHLDVDGVERRITVPGTPAKALHDLAVEEHASLIVLGVTHHRGAARAVPGSVAANLLHGAPCPVLVVPEGRRTDGPIRTVVAAFDGGDQAQVALRRAVDIARAAGARLRIVAAFDPPMYAGPTAIATSDLGTNMQGDVRMHVQDAIDTIADLEVDAVVTQGAPVDVVVEAAQDADLIVAGSRGYGPLHSVLVGGVSRKLVDCAPCPVLVVPRVAVTGTEDAQASSAAPQTA
jgi:nucleotide-binding universal stress UspA family protein